MMKSIALFGKIFANEEINFLLTNRIPRIAVTRFMGWFSQIRNPWICRLSIWIWRLFTDLDLSDSKRQSFDSLHDCFIRELKPEARPIDANPGFMISPCDGIIGAIGRVDNGVLYQAKGYPYQLKDLFTARTDSTPWINGTYITIRITSSMYHRFHAPYRGVMKEVHYISGDTWNVNPVALKRVESLFCKNERALLKLEVGPFRIPVAIVPVAAVLVASIRLHGIEPLLHLGYRGANRIACDIQFDKGDELGWFQHGSTIIVFAPPGFGIAAGIKAGQPIRMGQPLMMLPGFSI